MGREWWPCVIGERKCRLLDAQNGGLKWSWVASGGAMLLGNATADCSMGGVMAELLCLSTQTMWLEVRWRAKCCVLQ